MSTISILSKASVPAGKPEIAEESAADRASFAQHLGQASIPAVKQYLQLATEQKLDIDAICADIGLNQALLTDNSQHISGLLFQRLIAALLAQSKDDMFGLHTAKHVQPGSYSVLGYIFMNCENLAQAMTKIQPFEKLVGDMGVTTVASLGDKIKVSWHCRFTDEQVKRHMIDNCLGSWITFARYLVSEHSNPSEILLSRKLPALAQQKAYQAIFKCPVSYGQSDNAIIFDKSLLLLPLNKGDQQLLSTLESHAQALMSDLTPETNLPTQLQAAIAKSLKTGNFHQQEIAQQFGISAKTLQRRLAKTGLSFQTLLDNTRLNIAKQHLAETALNLNQISSELGFTEPRSFYRWFNKLNGQTPGDYRKNITS
ncbi:MAG: AraC family transcriptional regulator [Cognaticolwellia sp.]